MSPAQILVVIGLVIVFVAFAFAGINMLRGVTSKDPFSGFEGTFKGHLIAMIVMALGGLLFVVGLIFTAVDFLNRFIK